jgi:hypothetical protein
VLLLPWLDCISASCHVVTHVKVYAAPGRAGRVARWFMFKPKILCNFGKFWTALEWKMLVHFMTIWNILRPFGIIYCLLA